MHFYEFNIGDYAKKTQHLTNEEDLAYRRALDMYYDTEKPLPITHGLATLSRRLRVSEIALKNVIDEFFPDGKNKHADEKIAEYHSFLNRQKANGSKGGRPKVSQNNPVVSQNNPSPSQPLTTKPLTTNQENKYSSATNVAGDDEQKIYTPAFLTFWDLYPNRVNKGAAFKAFKKIRATEYQAIREGLERKKQSRAWIKDNGQFIPHAATWLNARGWEDEDAKPKAAAFDVNEWARSKCA